MAVPSTHPLRWLRSQFITMPTTDSEPSKSCCGQTLPEHYMHANNNVGNVLTLGSLHLQPCING